MRYIIPPNTTFSQRVFDLLCQWFVACGLTLSDIDGTQPMYIDTSDGIQLTTVYGVAKAPIVQPAPELVEYALVGFQTDDPFPDIMELAEAKVRRDNVAEPDPYMPAHRFVPGVEDSSVCGQCDEAEQSVVHSLPIDDIASLVDQLRTARDEERAAKERAEEARDQILSRMINEGYKIGTVNGRPAVQWVPVTSNRFQTKKFQAAHPDLAAEYTEPSTSNRLEVL